MSNITAKVARTNAPYDYFNSFRKEDLYQLDLADPTISDMLAVGTHQIVAVPKGMILVDGFLLIKADIAGGVGATVQIGFNGSTLTKAITLADLKAGNIIKFDLQTAVIKGQVLADVAYLEVTVGTAPLTAGAFSISPVFADSNLH